MTALSRAKQRPVTLDDIPRKFLAHIAEMGFEWVWLLSVWQTGAAGRRISRLNPAWRREFEHTLPDLQEEDIGGSGFAITGYSVSEALGGDGALAKLRERLRKLGLRLMLDFVPNHTGLDHPWVTSHPEYYIAGTAEDLMRRPQDHARTGLGRREPLAHGRDPFSPGWPDTFQLNYGNPAVQEAMMAELVRIADHCDGVRCDMSMLLLPEVFERTWGIRASSFWPEATRRVRKYKPGFCFMAEVYWDLEEELLRQGFDYAYDKRLYDLLRQGQSRPVREHLRAGRDYQKKLTRFLENHDEMRAAAAFPAPVHKAAAVITFLCPGLKLFHQGQFEGHRKHISPHLCRGPEETVDLRLKQFYEKLLAVLRRPVVRNGDWQLLECVAAWEGNWTHDCFVAFAWQGVGQDKLVVAVNFAPNQSQCFIRLPFSDLGDSDWHLRDLLGEQQFDRDGKDLQSRGLYLDVPPWCASVYVMDKNA